jgi:hypothetical protein
MATALHIVREGDGWAVKREGAHRASSRHSTKAEATDAARRIALRSGGAEVVTHRRDGRISGRNTYGAARTVEEARAMQLSPRESRTAQGTRTRSPAGRRAPRSDGPRTTLRLPRWLGDAADRLAAELGISRNDALLRFAARGARLFEAEAAIAQRRAARWEAVIGDLPDLSDTEFPSTEEIGHAVLAARGELAAAVSE